MIEKIVIEQEHKVRQVQQDWMEHKVRQVQQDWMEHKVRQVLKEFKVSKVKPEQQVLLEQQVQQVLV